MPKELASRGARAAAVGEVTSAGGLPRPPDAWRRKGGLLLHSSWCVLACWVLQWDLCHGLLMGWQYVRCGSLS